MQLFPLSKSNLAGSTPGLKSSEASYKMKENSHAKFENPYGASKIPSLTLAEKRGSKPTQLKSRSQIQTWKCYQPSSSVDYKEALGTQIFFP